MLSKSVVTHILYNLCERRNITLGLRYNSSGLHCVTTRLRDTALRRERSHRGHEHKHEHEPNASTRKKLKSYGIISIYVHMCLYIYIYVYICIHIFIFCLLYDVHVCVYKAYTWIGYTCYICFIICTYVYICKFIVYIYMFGELFVLGSSGVIGIDNLRILIQLDSHFNNFSFAWSTNSKF